MVIPLLSFSRLQDFQWPFPSLEFLKSIILIFYFQNLDVEEQIKWKVIKKKEKKKKNSEKENNGQNQ